MGSFPDLKNDKKTQTLKQAPPFPLHITALATKPQLSRFLLAIVNCDKSLLDKGKAREVHLQKTEEEKKKNTGKPPRKLPSKTHMAPNCFRFNKPQEKKKLNRNW